MLLVLPLLSTIYSYLNNNVSTYFDISIELDRYIPIIPIFAVPYIMWYVFMFCYLVYFCMKDTTVYMNTLITIIIGKLICFVIYILFQTTVPRPELSGNDFFTHLVQFIYNYDEPYNCFPSIHVLTTFTIMLASIHIKAKHAVNTFMIHLLGTLIILSTLFIKQHAILDVIASIVLVILIYLPLHYYSLNKHKYRLKKSRRIGQPM